MNAGERDELLLKFKLIDSRKNGESIPALGIIPQKVGFQTGGSYVEYKDIPTSQSLQAINELNNTELTELAESLGISKASSSYKADVIINGFGVSLKSTRKGPPAIVNHTNRIGWQFAANHSKGNINELDRIVEEYWRLRSAGEITEDIRNTDPKSPFSKHILTLKPFLNYFLFDGTGSRLSVAKADYIISFTDPASPATWSVSDRTNAVRLHWNRMIFSIRAKKGMPKNYPNVAKRSADKVPSIEKWTKHIKGDFRGALHVRTA